MTRNTSAPINLRPPEDYDWIAYDAQTEKSEQVEELCKMYEEKDKLINKINDLRAIISFYEKDCEELRKSLQYHCDQGLDLRKTNFNLQSEIKQLKGRERDLQQALNLQTERVDDLRNEVSKLQHKSLTSKDLNSYLYVPVQDFEKVKEQLDDLMKEHYQATLIIAGLKKDLDIVREREKTTQASYTKQIRDLREDKEELLAREKDQFQYHQGTVEELQRKLNGVEASLRACELARARDTEVFEKLSRANTDVVIEQDKRIKELELNNNSSVLAGTKELLKASMEDYKELKEDYTAVLKSLKEAKEARNDWREQAMIYKALLTEERAKHGS